jgi:hypothetical protein
MWVPVSPKGDIWAAQAHPNKTIVERRIAKHEAKHGPSRFPWTVTRAALVLNYPTKGVYQMKIEAEPSGLSATASAFVSQPSTTEGGLNLETPRSTQAGRFQHSS